MSDIEKWPRGRCEFWLTERAACGTDGRWMVGTQIRCGEHKNATGREAAVSAGAETVKAPVITAGAEPNEWEAGYQACYERMQDEGRLLPAAGRAAGAETATTRGNLAQALLATEMIDRLLDYAKTGEDRQQVAWSWANRIADWLDKANGSWPAAQGEPPQALDYEAMRMEKGWPTPDHMRRTADALDDLTRPARYGDVLRWAADLCDDSLSQPRPRHDEPRGEDG